MILLPYLEEFVKTRVKKAHYLVEFVNNLVTKYLHLEEVVMNLVIKSLNLVTLGTLVKIFLLPT